MVRIRQDIDQGDFERRMQDQRASQHYEQLRLDHFTKGMDPNDTEPEDEDTVYQPPAQPNPTEDARAADGHAQQAERIHLRRLQLLQKLRSSQPHLAKPTVDQLTAESDAWSSVRDSQENASLMRITSTPHYLTGTLRPYQLDGVNWMLSLFKSHLNGILADEMGLGKTFQTVALLSVLRFTFSFPGPHLIVVPKSVMGNWSHEIRRWSPALRAFKFHGSSMERDDLIRAYLTPPLRFDLVITTFDMIHRESRAFKRIRWQYMIVDEAHKLKNSEGATFTKLVSLTTRRRLLLTGTPLQNNLSELWALLHFLTPKLFDNRELFEEWFDTQRGIVDCESLAKLHAVFADTMLRRLKSDVLSDLPPKREIYVSCPLTTRQRQCYLGVLAREATMVNAGTPGGQAALMNIAVQLRKAADHPYLFPGVDPTGGMDTTETIIQDAGKMIVLDKLLARLWADKSERPRHRVLIFSQMTSMLDILEDYLIMRGYTYCRLDGSTSSLQRELDMASFNSPNSDKFVFMLSTRAGGLGINLQAANHVVLYDSDWNPQADLQAQDRAHRIGQMRSVSVYRFITDGTIEERIYQRALKKLYLDAVVVEQGRLTAPSSPTSSSSHADRAELLSMIRFGATELFKAATRSSEITDEDIDALLDAGKAKQDQLEKQTMQETLATFEWNVEKTSLYDFEGICVKSEATRQLHLKLEEPMNEEELRQTFGIFGPLLCISIHSNLHEVLLTFKSVAAAADAKMRSGFACTFTSQAPANVVSSEDIDKYYGEQTQKRTRRSNWEDVEEGSSSEEDEISRRAPLPKPKRPHLHPEVNPRWYHLIRIDRLAEIRETEYQVLLRNWQRACERIVRSRTKDQQGENKPKEEENTEPSSPDEPVHAIDSEATAFNTAATEPVSTSTAVTNVDEEFVESLDPALLAERDRILQGGFFDWSRRDFFAFRTVLTSGTVSTGDFASLASAMIDCNKTPDQVAAYHARFMQVGADIIPGFDTILSRVTRNTLKAEREHEIRALCAHCVAACSITDTQGNSIPDPSRLRLPERFDVFDRALFVQASSRGWTVDLPMLIKLKGSPEFALDIFVQTRTILYSERRLAHLMRACAAVEEKKQNTRET